MKYHFLSTIHIIVLLITFTSITQSQTHNPKANPNAMVINNDVRFTILTPQLIRMEWAADKTFEDHKSFVFLNRNLPVPEFQTKNENGWLEIKTKKLDLKYKINSGAFSSDNLQIKFNLNDTGVTWHPGMQDTANLLGTIRTLDGVKGSTPLDSGLLSRSGWTLIDDSQRPLFDDAEWNWVMVRPEGERQDWYFFGYGHDYKKELYDFTRVAGKIPLPPKFAFGIWWSRYWNYTDEELKNLVNQFNTFKIPLDVLVIDMDWHLTQEGKWERKKLDQADQTIGWTGYTWNKDYFPEPKTFLDWTKSKGLKVTLNLHPASGIQPHEVQYEEMAKAMGVDPSTKKYIPFDITNKKFAANYFNLVIHPLEKMGIDFWWLDWQQWHTTPIPGVTPTWWLNYVFFTDMARQGKRPLLFHRWGGLGNHRYQIGFSGDTYSMWESLAFQPYFTSTASNVGFGYWSHDIGGHMPGYVEPELYTRWVQFGAFSPILRTHASKNPLAERRIWGYPFEYFNIMRDTYLLRYSLIPYIYTSAREAYDNGISLCRPMYYDNPESEEAYTFKNEFMFGDNILVAPIASPIDSTSLFAKTKIWLPEGEWIEWFTGTKLKGPAIVERNFSLEEIPVYVKAGSILPMQLESNSIDGQSNPLVLTIFHGDSGSVNYYEDNSEGLGYQNDHFTRTKILQQTVNGTQSINIFPTKGSFEGMINKRSYKIILPGILPPEKILCNGNVLNYNYDGDKLEVSFITPDFFTNQQVKIEVSQFPGESQDLINGFAGKLSRMKKVKELFYSKPVGENYSVIISSAQTGRRITLEPKNAINEIKKFNTNILEVKKIFEEIELDSKVKQQCLMQIKDAEVTDY